MSISSHFLDRAIEGLERGNVWIAFNRTFTDVEVVRKDCSVLRALKSSFLCGCSNKYSRIDAEAILTHLKKRDWSQISPTRVNLFYSLFDQSLRYKYPIDPFLPQINKEEEVISFYENIVLERSSSSEISSTLNLVDKEGNSELHQAILFVEEENVHPKTVLKKVAQEIERLVKIGIDPTIKNHAGDTVLHLIADLPYWESTHEKLVELLISHHAKANVRNNKGLTPLHQMVSAYCYASTIHLLINKGFAEVNEQDSQGNTALHLVAYSDRSLNSSFREKSAEVLIEYGADVNMPNLAGNTPLHMAILTRNDIKEPIEFFILKCNANINAQNEKGNTPLHLLASSNHFDKCNHVEMVKFLLEHGADKTIKNKNGQLPIHLAYERKGSKVIEHLQVDYEDDFINSYGQTFLHLAARDSSKDMEIFKQVLKKTKNIEAIDKFGDTALHYAVENGFYEAVELLIQSKVVIDASNKEGNTPLYLAVKGLFRAFGQISSLATLQEVKNIIIILHSNREKSKKQLQFSYDSQFLMLESVALKNIINQLLDSGANPYQKNNKGESVIDQCFIWGKMFSTFRTEEHFNSIKKDLI